MMKKALTVLFILFCSLSKAETNIDSLVAEYEMTLKKIEIPYPCPCYPCAMHCFKVEKDKPTFEGFIAWLKKQKL